MNQLNIPGSRSNSLQKNFRIFLYSFVVLTWVALLAKFALYPFHGIPPYFYIEVTAGFLLAIVFPLSIAHFYSQLCDYLSKQEEEYKKLFKTSPHAMWIYDISSLKFLLVNDAAQALYGYNEAEFLSLRISDIRPPEDLPALMDHVEKNNADFDFSYHWSGMWRHKKKNGQLIYVEVSSHRIIFEGKKAAFVLSYDVTEKVMQEVKLQTVNQELEHKVRERTHDLLLLNKKLIEQNKTIKAVNHDLANLSSELRNANEQIKEHAELKNRFISMVSHEFRTPLSAIQFAADFINRYHDRISVQQLCEKASSIRKQAIHMNALLNDVLTMGRTDSDKIKAIIEPLELKNFISGIIAEVLQATNRTHDIILEIGEVPEIIRSDEKLLRNIFINLLSNAIKYSPGAKKVLFQVTGLDDELCFKIQDYGIGIRDEEVSKIFEPFYRASEVRHIQGTGLGLSIVKRAIEIVGGKIEVEGSAGNGSVFTVSIPVASALHVPPLS